MEKQFFWINKGLLGQNLKYGLSIQSFYQLIIKSVSMVSIAE